MMWMNFLFLDRRRAAKMTSVLHYAPICSFSYSFCTLIFVVSGFCDDNRANKSYEAVT